MAILKCKMCGGDLDIQEGASVAQCEFCGSKQTVPKVDEVVKTEASEQKAESRSCSASKDAAKESEEFAKGKIAGLQEAVLALMEKNGPITDQMRKDVMDNVYHDSLINWIKSF